MWGELDRKRVREREGESERGRCGEWEKACIWDCLQHVYNIYILIQAGREAGGWNGYDKNVLSPTHSFYIQSKWIIHIHILLLLSISFFLARYFYKFRFVQLENSTAELCLCVRHTLQCVFDSIIPLVGGCCCCYSVQFGIIHATSDYPACYTFSHLHTQMFKKHVKP